MMTSGSAKPIKHRSVVSNFLFKNGKLSSSGTNQALVALFRRSHHPDIHSYQGKLAPVAGSIDPSDANAFAAAAREIREETQLIADEHIRLSFCGQPFSFSDEEAGRSWTVHPFGWEFVSDDAESRIVIDWEHDGWQWVPPENVFNGELKDWCVPRLDQSLQRVFFGPSGMFVGKWITRENKAGMAFSDGLKRLKTDKENGARVLATAAVTCLQTIVKHMLEDISSGMAQSVNGSERDWWKSLRIAAWQLIYSGRPSMNAATSSAILQALKNVESTIGSQKPLKEELQSAYQIFSDCLAEREKAAEKMSRAFQNFVESLLSDANDSKAQSDPTNRIKIVTLSSSSTIRAALLHVLTAVPDLYIDLSILESRPLCEGASLASAIIKAVNQQDIAVRSRLKITLAPDSHMTFLAQQIHLGGAENTPSILLLGADRISPSGHTSNKMGSCSAALVVKSVSPDTKVAVLSEADKIAKASDLQERDSTEESQNEMLEHVPESNDATEVTKIWAAAGAGEDVMNTLQPSFQLSEENKGAVKLKVENVYFEWVPAKYIDVYVSEEGILHRDRIKEKSVETKKLEEQIFGGLY